MRGKEKSLAIVFLVSLVLTGAGGEVWLYGQSNQQRLKYDSIVQRLARQHGVPADLIHSVIKIESDYNEKAVSPKGAMGLMQLMPETASYYGVQDPFIPEENIRGGILYLKDLIRLYNGKTSHVLAAYNAGQEALKKFNGIPPYPETIEYIRKVMALYSRPYIPMGLPIYRLEDGSGKVILTNDPLYLLNIQGKREIR